jgi:hypothetical protein
VYSLYALVPPPQKKNIHTIGNMDILLTTYYQINFLCVYKCRSTEAQSTVKLSSCLINHNFLKTDGGIRILNFDTRPRKNYSFTFQPLHYSEARLCAEWTGNCVGPRLFLNAVMKNKIPCSSPESNPYV